MNEYSESGSPSRSTETDIVPVSIERDSGNGIVITWSDSKVIKWTVGQLRKACPCATCREKKRGDEAKKREAGSCKLMMLPILSAAEAKPLTIESMQPVGSYAYHISFSDGHATGIYPFVTLYDLDHETHD